MKTHRAWLGSCCACIAWLIGPAPAAFGVTVILSDISRYRVIIERQPFGSPPSPAKLDTNEQRPALPPPPPFVKDLRLCFIGEGPIGRRVGFLNTRTGQNYYLFLNQTSNDGITVVQVDYAGGKVLLKKDDRGQWLAMEGGSAPAGGGPPFPVKAKPNEVSPRSAFRRTSYTERVRQRHAVVQSRLSRIPRIEDEALRTCLQEYQMDLIREGQTPLPVPLTEEMDDQLLREGVLPPAIE